MKHNKELDQILQEALSPDEEPSEWLNQKILRRAKERKNMDKKLKRRVVPAAAIVTAITVSLGSVGAFAAWKYLSPDKVAEVMEDKGLMEAFKSKDAITINESQTYGDLKITLLGMVSGKNLSKFMTNEEDFNMNRTYVVTAIEKADGTNMDFDKLSNIIVSPLVKGLKPWQFNVFYMGGGCESTISQELKVEYRITECDSVEMFADRGLYISVSDGVPGADNYQYNEKTGEITRNESYKGINALFNLPVDKSKADPEAAEKYLKEMEESITEEYEVDKVDMAKDALIEEINTWDGKEVEKNAKLLKELTQVLTPNKDGEVTTKPYKYENGNSGSAIDVGEVHFSVKDFFENVKVGEAVVCAVSGGGDEAYIETRTLNDDGTVTLKVYYYSEEKAGLFKNSLIDKVAKWDGKEVEKNAELLEDLTQILTPDKDGIVYSSAYKYGKSGEVGGGQLLVKDDFERIKVGETIVSSTYSGDPENEIYIETYVLNDDGTVTLKVYYYSEKK